MFKKLFAAAIVAITSIISYAQTTPKIGTIDVQAVVDVMPETNVFETEISKKRTTAQTELTKMQTELQNKAQALELEGDSLDEVTLQSRREEIQIAYQRMQQYQQAQSAQLEQYAQQQQTLIYEKIFKAMRTVGDREKFVVIFPTNDATYYSPTLTTDVTGLVKAELGIK